MKVHFPLTGFNLSGGVRVITMIANGLVERGYEVRITVPAYRSTPPFSLDDRVELKVLGDERTSRVGYSRLLVRAAAKWGEVLVATNFKTPHLIRKSIQNNGSNAKLLYLIQGYEPYTQGTLFEGPFYRRWLNRRVALSSYEKADFRCYVSRAIAKKVALDQDPWLVHPGQNPAIFYPDAAPIREDQVRVGVIAQSGKLKGSEVFFEAMNRVQDIHSKIQWIILRVGEIPFDPPTEAKVVVAQNDRDMRDFYRSLDVFVMPSLYEGFGLPALEAMATGAALITSNVDGAREFAVNERNALVVRVGDSEALAAAIRRLVLMSDLRSELACKGMETASRFTWNHTVDQFENLLQRIRNEE